VGRGSRCMVLSLCAAALFASASGSAAPAADFRQRLAEDEIVYFLLPDRFENGDPSNDHGGLTGGRLKTGYDPTAQGFYHGGDLRGVLSRLDYLQALGATAIWLAPVFKNKAVQGSPGHESAGYHGYWITDFTQVDPHFGTNADMSALVDAAHDRGIKVYLDIVVNHTADVIAYRECPRACAYRSRAEFPYQRRGGIGGEPINPGFLGDSPEYQTTENFARLTRPDYAYTPHIPPGAEHLKVPDWLNNPIYYHNRGESTFAGESSTMGDFVGLDDLMTENPRVVQGFIDIYGAWIDEFGVDGFRIDTARHVNPEFLQAFVPAMLKRAMARGIPNFHIFGEVAISTVEPGLLAVHTQVAKLPAVLDFAFAAAVRDVSMGVSGTDVLARLFAGDALYVGGESAALRLPTFVSNHDQGRYGFFLHRALPGISAAEQLEREILAYAMLLTLRGVPVIYYGDEQGFAGVGDDMAARQDMFVSQVASFNAEPVIGADSGAASRAGSAHFNPDHPLYRAIQELAQLRSSQPALRRGRQIVRSYAAAPGLFAVSRIEPDTGREVLIAFNTSLTPLRALVEVAVRSTDFESLHGHCEATASAPGSVQVSLAPLDFIVCRSVH
jgi:glycosidase